MKNTKQKMRYYYCRIIYNTTHSVCPLSLSFQIYIFLIFLPAINIIYEQVSSCFVYENIRLKVKTQIKFQHLKPLVYSSFGVFFFLAFSNWTFSFC